MWDPSVRFFRLYRNGELKGYLYIDPYARPGGGLRPTEAACFSHEAAPCYHGCMLSRKTRCAALLRAAPPLLICTEKSAGAWMDGIVGESKLLAAPGEALRLPVAIIVTNQSPPVGNETALMTME